MKKLIPVICLLLSHSAQAQWSVELLRYPFRPPGAQGLHELNGTVYFNGTDSMPFVQHSFKATEAMKPVVAGIPADSFTFDSRELDYDKHNGKIYFTGILPTAGAQLFEFDGVNPPKVLTSFPQTGTYSPPAHIRVINNRVYFSLNDFTLGEGYEYDIATTTLRKLDPSGVIYRPGDFVSFNGKVYFWATDPTHGLELFMFDPATGVASLAVDVEPGSFSGMVGYLVVRNGKLYFAGRTNADGTELFEYDGTNPPVPVTTLSNGSNLLQFSNDVAVLRQLNDDIFFGGTVNGLDYNLYKFNTTTKNTTTIPVPGATYIAWVTPYANNIVMAVRRGNHSALWYYDGINAPQKLGNVGGIDSVGRPNSIVRGATSMLFLGNDIYNANVQQVYKLTNAAVSTAIKAPGFDGSVAVYPNPAKDNVTISITAAKEQQLNVHITDVLGKTVYTTGYMQYNATKADVVIPVASWAAGSYYYTLTDDKGVVMEKGKLVKE